MCSLIGFSQDENQNLESSSVIEFIEHKVKRKQTLYTISNLYDVPINLIKKYNPSLKLCLAICYELNTTLDELFWKGLEDER